MFSFLTNLQGYRTYISAAAAILFAVSSASAAVATALGGLSLDNGVAIVSVLGTVSTACLGLAQIFQRIAVANTADLPQEISNDLKAIRDFLAAHHQPPLPVNPTPAVPSPFDNVPGRVVTGLLVAVMFLTNEAYAVPPVAVISGPHTAEAGEEVILDGSKSENAKVFAWRVYPKLDGRKQLTSVTPDNKQIRLATYPGRYTIKLLVASDDGIDDHDFVVTIPGNPPCPPMPDPQPTPNPTPLPVPPIVPIPNPQPIPTPTPVIPELPPGEFDGLPSAIKALALSVVSATRAAEAAKLADAFEAINSQIAAKTLSTPITILAGIAAAFNVSTSQPWDVAFRPTAIARMKTLYEGGKLATPERWRAMLAEAVTGLRAVK